MLPMSWLKSEWRKMKTMFATSTPPPVVELEPLRSMADVDQLIARAGFESAASMIRERAQPCVRAMCVDAKLDANINTFELGATRFGGLPDLPRDTPWPADGESLFLGQVRSDDLMRVAMIAEDDPVIPKFSGLLSFFASPEWNAATVILTPLDTELVRLNPPKNFQAQDELTVLNPVEVRWECAMSIPTTADRLFEHSLRQLCPEADFDAFNDQSHAPSSTLAQLFGNTSAMDDFHTAAALDELGFEGSTSLLVWQSWESWEEAKKKKHKLRNGTIYTPWTAADDDKVRWLLANHDRIVAETKEWQLLLSVNSNKEMNLWINDADSIYVMIRRDDLAKLDFSRVRVYASQS